MAKKEVEVVGIKLIEKVNIPIRIIGDSPLIVHAWSEKAKKEILGKQTKATKTKAKEARNPFQEYCDALYWMTDRPEEIDEDTYEKLIEDGARFGFPVNAIKMAGNSVVPIMAQKLVAANCGYMRVGKRHPNPRHENEDDGQIKFIV